MMILQGFGQGFGNGHGLGTLTRGAGFNCTSTICYGIGQDNDNLLRELQRQLNRFQGRSGIAFKLLVTDGKIGTNTVNVAQMVGRWIAANLPATIYGASIVPLTTATKETLAAGADALVPQLSSIANQIVTPPPQNNLPTPQPGSTEHPGSDAVSVNPIPAPSGSNLGWWVLGGLAVVGAGTVLLLHMRRNKTATYARRGR